MSVLAETTFTNKLETREIVDEVMEHAFESVCSTMGPNGSYVVINQLNKAKVTKDGVSVAKALDFNEARRNLIAEIITEPSIKTDNEVGDGTTTTVFMTYQLYKAFGSSMTFKNTRYLDKLIEEVITHIGTLIKPGDIYSDEFRAMLMTSSNYEEEIVDKVLEIYQNNTTPNIRLLNVPTLPRDEIEYTTEIKFDGGFGNPNYVPKGGFYGIGAGGAYFVLVDGHIQGLTEKHIHELNYLAAKRHVFLLARNFDPNAINILNAENQRIGKVSITPFRIQAAGSLGTETISDLGKLLGVEPIFGLDNMNTDLVKTNHAEVIMHESGILFDKEEDAVGKVIPDILELLDERYEAMSIVDRQTPVGRELFRRISRLRANNVTLKVTGVTPSDASERYYRYEDVMKAARTGQQFGVIPGIGYGYLSGSDYIRDQVPAQSDEDLEWCRTVLIDVLATQYEHLTGNIYSGEIPEYIDLVTGEKSNTPMNVYDNAAATMIALRGAWQTAKTLGKISNVMGRSNKSY
ncbi:hypothetical protein D5W64_12455 [Salmonella enterica subsp. enterica serovar Saintpaul]|nr:hypothetical protein [Salmonella enterica subsp. enterica serovar Saintpaul]